MYHLISIKFSHFNEKARWALERFGVPYHESGYMPLFHMPAVALATLGHGASQADKMSSRFSTPLLITDTGRRIHNSGEILRFVSTRHAPPEHDLYPTEEAEQLERSLGDTLGTDTRRVVYSWIIDDDETMNHMAALNVGPLQARLFSAFFRHGRPTMRKLLKINPKRTAHSRERLNLIFDDISSRLADGRPFLLGDRFSAADLTFAALSSIVLGVNQADGFGAYLPTERTPEGARPDIDRWSQTPAGQHAIRMYREHRGPLKTLH